jgi:hypothetical protein
MTWNPMAPLSLDANVNDLFAFNHPAKGLGFKNPHQALDTVVFKLGSDNFNFFDRKGMDSVMV